VTNELTDDAREFPPLDGTLPATSAEDMAAKLGELNVAKK
jgi:hypothetical protein